MGMMTRRNVKARPAVAVMPLTKPVEKPIEKPVEKPVEETVESTVTREEIEKMPYFSLKAFAANNGIDVEGKKAAKLKEEIIKKLKL